MNLEQATERLHQLARSGIALPVVLLSSASEAEAFADTMMSAYGLRSDDPDRLTIRPERSIKLEQAHELIEHLQTSPMSGSLRIGCIHQVECLSAGAANALLKALEEIPESAMVIMTTANPGQVMATIRSRAIHWPIASAIPSFELDPRWSILLGASSNRGEKLQAAEWLSKSSSLSPTEILEGTERQLNLLYRAMSSNHNQEVAQDLLPARRRRELQRLRKMVSFAKVPVNTQLMVEAIAMPIRIHEWLG